ncbi:hypothetical protein B566_EDAN013602 [Ephemera danica]|nr:hypothetical protein B566_EDAN013602 [Ephemera danica]
MHHPRSSFERLYLSRKVGGRGLLNLETLCRSKEQRLQTYFVSHGSLMHQATSELTAAHVDLKESTEWLRTASLFSETEGFLLAIQDQVVRTRNYERHILKTAVDDRCRLCKKSGKTIQHITGGCSVLAPKEYLERHNAVAKVVHQALATQHGLVETETPYYKYNHVVTTCAEKRRKYQPLAVELKHMYRLREVTIVPVVVSVNGLVNSDWKSARKLLQLKQKHMRIMQKAAILGTANIVRKVLNL